MSTKMKLHYLQYQKREHFNYFYRANVHFKDSCIFGHYSTNKRIL